MKTDGTPLTREERHQLAFAAGSWAIRPCGIRRSKNTGWEDCERYDCNEWYRTEPGGCTEESLYTMTDSLPLDTDTVLQWLKKQNRVIRISGGDPGVMWQIRVTRASQEREHYAEHVLHSRSRNAVRLEDAVLRAGYDILTGVIP